MSLDSLGPLLNANEMAALWQITKSRFYRLAKTGAFDLFKVTPTISPRCYSKALVARHLAGEPLDRARTFGRKRSA